MVKKEEAGFEHKLEKLEEIVRRLEDEGTPLEEALALFGEGVALSRELSARLEDIKGKIEILRKDAEGKLRPEPFGGEK